MDLLNNALKMLTGVFILFFITDAFTYIGKYFIILILNIAKNT